MKYTSIRCRTCGGNVARIQQVRPRIDELTCIQCGRGTDGVGQPLAHPPAAHQLPAASNRNGNGNGNGHAPDAAQVDALAWLQSLGSVDGYAVAQLAMFDGGSASPSGISPSVSSAASPHQLRMF